MSDKNIGILDVKRKSKTEPNLLVDSQSYLLETSASLNLLDRPILISCFQVFPANTGITASMQLLNWTRTTALKKTQSIDKC